MSAWILRVKIIRWFYLPVYLQIEHMDTACICSCMSMHRRSEENQKSAVDKAPYQPLLAEAQGREVTEIEGNNLSTFLFVTLFKQTVTQCRLSTVTQLLFLASIYVDAFTKLGRNAPLAYITQETNPSSPQCSCIVLTHTLRWLQQFLPLCLCFC